MRTRNDLRVLGLSAFHHDSTAVLLQNGTILAAVQEERFTRKRHDSAFPHQALAYCLAQADCAPQSLDLVMVAEPPIMDIAPNFRTAVAAEVAALGIPADRLRFCRHDLSHAASAFFPSPFNEATVLVLDGIGDHSGEAVMAGSGNRLDILSETLFPNSLGLLYSVITAYLGFKPNSGEYKVMGLAPYGKPLFVELLTRRVAGLDGDGIFRPDMSLFQMKGKTALPTEAFSQLVGHPPRLAEAPLSQFHMDMAASIQALAELALLRRARSICRTTGSRNLCLAGGAALNCVANGKILREAGFDGLWIQPAAGDAGTALGAAMAGQHLLHDRPRKASLGRDAMQGTYLGPEWPQPEIEARLTAMGARFHILPGASLLEETARALSEGKIVGWVQGRMEFGPRALGARSILGDPRSPSMQKLLNLKIKFREGFRPFAPSILKEDAKEWFDLEGDSPYMLLVAPVAQQHRRTMTAEEQSLFGIDKLNLVRSSIPAVTHLDYSARIQTVATDGHPRFRALLEAFKARTNCGMLVNTSFNVRGEPIVCTPEDAFRCFMGSGIEVLAIGDCFLMKDDQDPSLACSTLQAFDAD